MFKLLIKWSVNEWLLKSKYKCKYNNKNKNRKFVLKRIREQVSWEWYLLEHYHKMKQVSNTFGGMYYICICKCKCIEYRYVDM